MSMTCHTVTNKVVLEFKDELAQVILNDRIIAGFDISVLWDQLVTYLAQTDSQSGGFKRRSYEASQVYKSSHEYLAKEISYGRNG